MTDHSLEIHTLIQYVYMHIVLSGFPKCLTDVSLKILTEDDKGDVRFRFTLLLLISLTLSFWARDYGES